jgi:exopolysaccharide biosynthesis protein
MRCLAGLIAVVLAAAPAAAEPTIEMDSEPYAGIRYQIWSETNVVRLYVVRVDLSSQEIGVYATAERNSGVTTSAFANLINAQVAINGGMFTVPGNKPIGLAIGDEGKWDDTADDCQTAVLHFGRAGARTYAAIDPADDLTTDQTLPEIRQGAISGRPMLVRSGAAIANYDREDPVTIPYSEAPRTAVGVSEDQRYLYLVVVDGWQTASRGMALPELASFMAERGSHMAFALDSGASSTMFVERDGVVSRPSDGGNERLVANHLAIKYQNLPKNTLRGFICKSPDIMACGVTPSMQILGALVKLDDGTTQTTMTTGEYIFPDVTQRWACVTASKLPMYPAKTQCKQVTAGGAPIYNSIHLEANTVQPPDPGPPGLPAGGGVPCDEIEGDNTEVPDDPGCCEAGDLGPSRLLLVALVAFMLTRRRGTKA